ncbi:hypothetical protein F4820DRAFT_132393 [Hypoxylon rubiginosum]|uniref:Uncharacterized protein n=1 Tax=Hypoxylon rubiginosum TaxID=110542 RepID=A0ACB9YL92_9PEZI|nr:hypothetical protein F4820DRAFT_132393 [Hypoxylon rubiginosum]
MIDWDDKWTLQERIRLLRRGKISWFTPEQRIPAVIFKRGDVVDYKINVWAIGLVMFNLLTLGHPDDSEGWVPEMTDLDLADFGKPVRVGRVLSWGSLLIRDPRRPLDAGVAEFISSYDGSLRNLIARCMCDDARHRPTLDSLTRMIERGIERADARVRDYVLAGELRQELSPAKPPLFEIDRLLAKFYSDYFYEPHVSEDPYAQYWVDGTPPGAIRIPTAPGRSAPINDLNPMQGVRPGGAPPRNDPGRTQGIRPGGAPPRNDPNRMQGVRQGGAPLRNDPNRMQGIRQGGAPLRNDPNRMQGIRRRGVPDDEFNIWQFPPDEPRFSMQ